jgi:phospholipid/cholesterol/gamma-HCH transport system substrate-binding protein
MSSKAQYFKIGAFILSAVTIIVVAIVALSAGKWFNNVYWESYFDESVQGLAIGAPIKYRGVQVGTVDKIAFVGDEYGSELSKEDLLRYGRYVVVSGSGQQMAVHLTEEQRKAERASSILAGLRVRLVSQGVTGVVYLEADYRDPTEYPAMEVPWTPRREYFPSAPSTVTVLGTALHNIARNLERADIHKVISDLDTLVLDVTKMVRETDLQEVSRQAGQMLVEFKAVAQQVRRLVESEEFKSMIADAASTVKGTRALIVDLSQASKQIKNASDTFPETFIRLQRSVRRVDTLLATKSEDFEATLENLRVVSENLREVTDHAKRYPAQVLLGEPPPRAGTTKR